MSNYVKIAFVVVVSGVRFRDAYNHVQTRGEGQYKAKLTLSVDNSYYYNILIVLICFQYVL